jgi:hypothetical protein
MRILIVAPQRTGGNVFSKWLSFELSYRWVHEPFHINHNMLDEINDLMLLNNVVMKLNPHEWDGYYDEEKLFNSFDKIIGLTRKDIYDSAISFVKAIKSNNFTGRYNVDDEWINQNKQEIDYHYNELKNNSEFVKNIKNSIQITYEGFYLTKKDVSKVKEYLNMGEFKYHNLIDEKNKYRNNKNPIKLI